MTAREGPPTAKRSPVAGGPKAQQSGQLVTDPSLGVAQHEPDTLFDAIAEHGAYGNRRVTVTMHEPGEPPVPGPRGPGRRVTSGPTDAAAPAYWLQDAEAVILATVRAGRTVSADDLHELYADEPSATGNGNAYGRLFSSLAARGLLREAGWVRSTRPEARGRRVVLWAAGAGR